MAKPIVVQIVGDAQNFTATLGDAGSRLDSFAAQFATAGGASLAFGSAILGVGVALFQMGQSVDDAFDRMQVQTGASGQALTDLEGTVNRIAQTVPSSFGDIADAVGGLAQRLDLTGPPLEALATQILNLSHITGTDVTTNVQAVTGLFNNWSVATADQTGKLDELFRTSQETGIAVAELGSIMAQNGAVLRDAGYSFEGAAAFVGSLAKQGVDAASALAGLRHAISAEADARVKAQKDEAKAAEDASARAVAAAERRKSAEERLGQIMKENARQTEDAAKALADATENAAEVEVDTAKDVARANEEAAKRVADVIEKHQPVNNGAVAMADYQKRLADAQEQSAQQVADAEDSAAKRRKDAAKRVTDDQERVARAAEDSADRITQANQQTADANERAGARVRTSSTATAASVAVSSGSTADSISAVIAKIEALGPGAEAQGLALQTFGSRAGEQMYAALTHGGEGVDQLRGKIENGSNTINQAAKDTADFGESWQRLKNDLAVAFEPAAMAIFDGVSAAIEHIITDFPVGIQVIKDQLKGLVTWIGNSLGGFVQNIGLPHFAAGGQMMASGWATINERSSSGSESVWLPQGAQVRPSWSGGGGGGGDTYNIQGYDMSPTELANEIAWQRRRGNGR